jgi:hypothetical protein
MMRPKLWGRPTRLASVGLAVIAAGGCIDTGFGVTAGGDAGVHPQGIDTTALTTSSGGAQAPIAATDDEQSGGLGGEATPASDPSPVAGASGAVASSAFVGAIQNLPCDASAALATHCQKCHGSPPIGGAPMPLLTVQDLQRPAATQPSMKVYELALMRLDDAARPMPPGGELADPARKTLRDWLVAGAPPAPPTAAECTPAPIPAPTLQDQSGITPLPGETCYELRTHGGQTADDRTPLTVGPGEQNEQFYFKVPWPAGTLATRMGTHLDNARVLHHWLLFTTGRGEQLHGTHESVLGTQLGDSASQLIGNWALGGQAYEFPADMGFELPDSGMLNLQWHYANTDSAAATDASAVQICTVPAGTRSKTLGITWLGTEYFNGPFGMPAHVSSRFGGTCRNSSGMPVTIWAFFPHMHKLGRRLTSIIKRVDGSLETAFDKAFDYNHQIHYELDPMITLQPGDEITSTCTFDNVTDANVAFGPLTTQEMCYLLTYSYPAGALENHVFSLIGASNTCW